MILDYLLPPGRKMAPEDKTLKIFYNFWAQAGKLPQKTKTKRLDHVGGLGRKMVPEDQKVTIFDQFWAQAGKWPQKTKK